MHPARVKSIRTTLGLFLLLGFAGACTPGGDDDGADDVGDDGAPTDECLSGIEWVGGNQESSRMNPGQDCLGCHAQFGEAEEVVLGGTIYDDNERDNCYGVEGVTVEITDSTNAVFTATSNTAGNFMLFSENGTITPPYSVKLLYEGRERQMFTMQTVTSCNSCHTETGLNGAPGRILAP
jgi:hypothetical protein